VRPAQRRQQGPAECDNFVNGGVWEPTCLRLRSVCAAGGCGMWEATGFWGRGVLRICSKEGVEDELLGVGIACVGGLRWRRRGGWYVIVRDMRNCAEAGRCGGRADAGGGGKNGV
jgi:hypothetical protein